MESVKNIVKTLRSMGRMEDADYIQPISYVIFGCAALYMFYRGQLATVGLALGVALVLYALLPKNLPVALIAGALAGLIATHYSRTSKEGFSTAEDEEESEGFVGEEEEEEEEPFSGDTAEEEARPRTAKKKKNPPPDNGSRKEFLTLGKKYKLPNEEDDKEFHLDAGTTFMNAYKSLKPDQINAMTKDTQELMQTQKQLMSTLQTLKPLITDGKQMMDMFQGYFGSGNPTA
jgi:hypothetical protein